MRKVILLRKQFGSSFLSICLMAGLILTLVCCGGDVATDGGSSQITATLSWDANTAPDVAGYKVYYGTAPDNYTVVEDVALTDTPDAPKYIVTDLEPGVSYYFAVTVYDASGNESGLSNQVFFTVS